MSVVLTNNFLSNARGLTFKDAGSVTWSIDPVTNSITAAVAAGGTVTAIGSTTLTIAGTSSVPTVNLSALQVTNIGKGGTALQVAVTALTGTANQIAASASTGSVTLSLASNVVIPAPVSGTAFAVNGLNSNVGGLIGTFANTSGTSAYVTYSDGTVTAFIQAAGSIPAAFFGTTSNHDVQISANGAGVATFGKAGGLAVGTPTGGTKGPGTVNAAGAYYANGTAGISATIATTKLTAGGANGSMTFVNGILTAQTPAT